MSRRVYTDPTDDERPWVAEHETRDDDGEVHRTTEWFATELEAHRYARTGETS